MLTIRTEQWNVLQGAVEISARKTLASALAQRRIAAAQGLEEKELERRLDLTIAKGKHYRMTMLESYITLFEWIGRYGPDFDLDPRIQKVLSNPASGDGQLGILIALELLPDMTPGRSAEAGHDAL
jgi:hypothetical protein